MTVTVSDTFFYNGVPTNGATVRLWPITSFTTQPAQDTALPGGSSSYGPITTATTYGGAGAWAFDVEPGEYWASVQYGGRIGWGHIIGGVGADPGANQLTNGGFDIWQRGVGSFSASTAFGPDRWQLLITGGDTLAVSQTAVADSGSLYAASCAVVAASATSRLNQKIENYQMARGRTMSLSVRVKCSVANVVRVSIQDSINGSRYSSYHTGSGNWETLTVSAAPISSAALALYVEINFGIGSYTAVVDNAMLIYGATPAAFLPLTPAEDLARCQRYYEVHGGFANALIVRAVDSNGAGRFFCQSMRYYQPKGGTPTVTKVGTWTVANCPQPAAGNVTQDGYDLSSSTTAAGAASFSCASASTYVTVEWNP